MENKKLNLVLTSDKNYIKLLVPCIISILKNKREDTEIDIYILETGINEYHKKKIKELENFNNTSNCKIEFLDANEKCNKLVNQNFNYFYYTSAILYILAIPQIFEHLDKVLYIDIDTIIKVDLLQLYNQDFENNYCCLPVSNPLTYKSKIYKNDIIVSEDYGLSSGIVLFNIKKILYDNKHKELMDIANKYPNALPRFLDQDMIGNTFKSKIKNIEHLYECLVETEDMICEKSKSAKKTYLYNIKNCNILHYAYSIKPFRLDKLEKMDRITSKIFYNYYQQSYLKINPIKLKWIFLIANLKRLRRYIIGVKKDKNHRRLLYFLNFQIVFSKGR